MERYITARQALIIKSLLSALTVLAIFLSFPKAFADKFNTETIDDVRALGMGTTGVNTARGPDAVFYNPANLAAKDTGTNIQPLNIQYGMSEGLLGQQLSAFNFTNLSSLASTLKSTPNTYAGGQFSVFPNITIRNFSIGILYSKDEGALYRAYDGALRVMARDRFAPTAAFSQRFFSGILRLGASAQLLTVGNADTAVAQPIPSNAQYSNYINSGTGFVGTAGATLTLPVRYLPSFSLVSRNIGGTRYMQTGIMSFGTGTNLPVQPMTYDFGSSMTFYFGKRLEMKAAFDYHDITNELQGDGMRHVFTGTEFTLYDILKFRAGLAHGYPSAGFGLYSPRSSIDFAVYSDEMDDRLRGAQETRYTLQYTWSIFK